MKQFGKVEIEFEYDDDDINWNDGEPYVTRAFLNGFGSELHQDILEVINDDAMCQNQFENDMNDKFKRDKEDYDDWKYHSLVDARFERWEGAA